MNQPDKETTRHRRRYRDRTVSIDTPTGTGLSQDSKAALVRRLDQPPTWVQTYVTITIDSVISDPRASLLTDSATQAGAISEIERLLERIKAEVPQVLPALLTQSFDIFGAIHDEKALQAAVILIQKTAEASKPDPNMLKTTFIAAVERQGEDPDPYTMEALIATGHAIINFLPKNQTTYREIAEVFTEPIEKTLDQPDGYKIALQFDELQEHLVQTIILDYLTNFSTNTFYEDARDNIATIIRRRLAYVPNQEIAGELGISIDAVKRHASRMLQRKYLEKEKPGPKAKANPYYLMPREIAVYQAVLAGKSFTEIATRLGIKPHTVSNYYYRTIAVLRGRDAAENI